MGAQEQAGTARYVHDIYKYSNHAQPEMERIGSSRVEYNRIPSNTI